MKYLCLCYYEQKKLDALSKSDLDALGRACQPHDEALRNSGRLILVGSLALPASSRAVRPAGVAPSVTDGAYLGGGIEVRPIDMLDQPALEDAPMAGPRDL